MSTVNESPNKSTTAQSTTPQQPESGQDLTIYVQNLLSQMQGRFQEMSSAILNRIDELGTRIDDLEKTMGEIMSMTGVEEQELREAEQHADSQMRTPQTSQSTSDDNKAE